jgi:hypothetical protein
MQCKQCLQWVAIATPFALVVCLRLFSSVFTKRRELPPPLPHPLVPAPCSFALFQNYVKTRPDGYLPGTGHWSRLAGSPNRYYPDLCTYPYGPKIPVNRLLQCIDAERLRYVVLAGDSNSMRYFKAFRRMLSGLPSFRCRTDKADRSSGYSVNVKYYGDANFDVSHVIPHDRDCHGCKNNRFRCDFVTTSNVTAHIVVESIVLEFTIDTEITSRKPIARCVQVTCDASHPRAHKRSSGL